MASKSVAKVSNIANRKRVKVTYRKANKTNTKYPALRLPFVVRNPGSKTIYWDVPKTDGYGTGCNMGSAAAKAFMKALRARTIDTGGTLQHIVIDMIESGIDPGRDGDKGVIVGFFSILDEWLVASAKTLGSGLDKVSEQQIEEIMTLAANETEDEHSQRYDAWIKARYA